MFWLNKIRETLFHEDRPERARRLFRTGLKKSESPFGLAVMALMGISLVILLDLAGDAATPTGNNQQPEPKAIAAEDLITQSVADEIPTQTQATPDEPDAQPDTITTRYRLRRNETLITLMRRAGISSTEAHKAVNALQGVADLRRLQRGQEVRIARTKDVDGSLISLHMRDSFDEEAFVIAEKGNFRANRSPITTLQLTHLVEGEITDSLYLSAQRAGLPTPVIVELIRLMSFDVDFEREIREGDRFQVYFERAIAPEFKDISDGRILHVRLELRKRTLEATYFRDEDGRGDYFDADGNSTRKALMKTPLDVTVVTSSYGRRKHPVLGYTRMHKGVDFRARTGTPIMAAGDGVVERASRYGSYGNYIRIRHNSTYKTSYAHLSRYGKGIKAGARVRQGQIIGYAGATGRVNAAHLHYEVLVNGQQANPLTLKLPTGRTLKGEQLLAFQKNQSTLLADIEQIQRREQILAHNEMVQPAHNSNDPLVNMGDR